MSEKRAWVMPTWFTPEDCEGYERLSEAVHEMGKALRAAAGRAQTELEMSGFLARMGAITRDVNEWTGRLNRLAPPTTTDEGEAA